MVVKFNIGEGALVAVGLSAMPLPLVVLLLGCKESRSGLTSGNLTPSKNATTCGHMHMMCVSTLLQHEHSFGCCSAVYLCVPITLMLWRDLPCCWQSGQQIVPLFAMLRSENLFVPLAKCWDFLFHLFQMLDFGVACYWPSVAIVSTQAHLP